MLTVGLDQTATSCTLTSLLCKGQVSHQATLFHSQLWPRNLWWWSGPPHPRISVLLWTGKIHPWVVLNSGVSTLVNILWWPPSSWPQDSLQVSETMRRWGREAASLCLDYFWRIFTMFYEAAGSLRRVNTTQLERERSCDCETEAASRLSLQTHKQDSSEQGEKKFTLKWTAVLNFTIVSFNLTHLWKNWVFFLIL